MIVMAVATAVLSAGVVSAKPVRNACDATAKSGVAACKDAGRSMFSLAVGTCKNISDDATRKQCLDDAKSAAKEIKGDCGDQGQARHDLCSKLGEAPYEPNPTDFVSPAEGAAHSNPYFPLVPGTVWVYKGGGETDTVTVTDQTKEILGVSTRVVHDTVTNDSDVVTEDTFDYFAQQADGTVWYFGELSEEFDNGDLVSLEGSWQAGRDGAQPGLIMKAAPMVGDVYRQEFLLGVAEDAAEVLSTTASESVPAATCSGDCVETHEFSPLDIGGDENKFYKSGVGNILEVDVESGSRLELQSFTPPP
jgi:hypothetical protein